MPQTLANRKRADTVKQAAALLLRRYDRSRPQLVKAGELGGQGNDSSFEQAFSSLAHAFISDKAPTLLDYEQGFQLLDKSEDNKKAVGVVAFKLGSQRLFAPVFFLNGQLKGHELLYVSGQDMFLPLKENWLNYLLNRKPNILGNGVPRNTSQQGVSWPDLNSLSRSPHSKFSSAAPPWLREFLPVLADTVQPDPARGLRKAAAAIEEHGRAFDLPTFLKQASLPMLEWLVSTCRKYPTIAAGIEQFHGLDCISTAIKAAGARARVATAGVPSVLDAPRHPPTQTGGSVLDVRHPIKTGALKVITYDVTQQTALPEGLTEEDREKLLRDTVLIKDARDPDETSVAYHTQVEQKLFNPAESGLYMVLVKPGEFEKCFIARQPVGPNGRVAFCTVVRVGDAANWLNTHPSRVWCCSQIEGKEYDSWYEGLTTAKTLSAGRTRHILVGPHGNATLPFCVTGSLGETYGGKSYEVEFSTFANHGDISGGSIDVEDTYGISGDYDPCRDGQRIHLDSKRQTKLRTRRGDVWVPDGFKLLTVKQDRYDTNTDTENKHESECSEGEGEDKCKCDDGEDSPQASRRSGYGASATPAIQPGDLLDTALGTSGQKTAAAAPLELGTLADAKLSVMSKTAALAIYHSGSETQINGRRMPPLAGLIHLVRDHGLAEGPARQLLKEAQLRRKVTCRIKYAAPFGSDPYLAGQGPDAPSIPDQQPGGDPMGAHVPTYGPEEHEIPVPGMSASQTNREIYNPNTNLDVRMGDRQTMDRATQTGQKEVFDTAMLGSMLKAVRDDTMIDRYLPDLLKGVDRLGRILFMFYWHQDKFAERYGKADMPELEDGLRNAFENLADVTLFLKQKTIEAYPEDDNAGMGIGSSEE